jgi:hypothetical protein
MSFSYQSVGIKLELFLDKKYLKFVEVGEIIIGIFLIEAK